MYYEVHKLSREGHSLSFISQYLGLNRRTVSKYFSMREQEYEAFIANQSNRNKKLSSYETFVKDRLALFPETSSAQMHDWLKEHHPQFPLINQKTVFNFVQYVRDQHNIPRIKENREYQFVEELPYGKQAQVDFGEYNLRSSAGKRVKVCFFVLVLSRSRFKFVYFVEQHFTAELAINAHEHAFEFIQGIPDEIVYDQDKVFMVSENSGDLILTNDFRAYCREKGFKLHFCRKADPESKGKVENVVKYVKQNFLYNRTFYNIETLNDEAVAWLGRTANHLPHSFTKREPISELLIERAFLSPYYPYEPSKAQLPLLYHVKKDNAISYKSNLYSLPLGTYKGRGCKVGVAIEGDVIVVLNESGTEEICRHRICLEKGKKILNNDHKRDKASALSEMAEKLACLFPESEKALEWLGLIWKEKPRYTRDQFQIIREVVEETPPATISKALNYCKDNNIASGVDFKAVVAHFQQEEIEKKADPKIKTIILNPLNAQLSEDAFREPAKSSINDYESLLNVINKNEH
ncbi:MAG: IS21 family transposase [bacterium]|nr:IS21 family transposase [bacterium]